MKSILFVLGLSLIASTSSAQHFSTGARTGASYWPAKTHDPEILKGDNGFSWDKSVYGRYESKGRFALEVDVAHNRFNFRYGTLLRDFFDAPSYIEHDRQNINDVLQGTISAQLRVTSVSSNLRSYLGTSLSYGRDIEQYSFIAEELSTKELSEHKWTNNYGFVFCGLNNFTSYTINEHLNIHSLLSFSVDPFDALSGYYPAQHVLTSKLSWTIGCGYTF